jgi:hypothetical protein
LLAGRAAIGYDQGYDGQLFYLGLALDPAYLEGFVEGCLERIGEDNPEEEHLFRDLWEDETQRETVVESLKADCEVRGRVDRPGTDPVCPTLILAYSLEPRRASNRATHFAIQEGGS